MPPASDWRSLTGHDYLKRLNRPGFAWEFLRRNPAYQEDYETMVRGAASDAGSGGMTRDALAWRWGLTFPGRSKICCPPSGRVLATGDAAHDRSAPTCAGQLFRGPAA
jgi:hypothetical protein